ncbi:MAG: hypothetical protein D6690_11020 [Nitrospirae bacterium]|nr:MAG: hypothetical protein D6690_11020 [Nitrospirota bacterium]
MLGNCDPRISDRYERRAGCSVVLRQVLPGAMMTAETLRRVRRHAVRRRCVGLPHLERLLIAFSNNEKACRASAHTALPTAGEWTCARHPPPRLSAKACAFVCRWLFCCHCETIPSMDEDGAMDPSRVLGIAALCGTSGSHHKESKWKQGKG